MKSDSIAKLADALSKAQGEMMHAHKDKENPYFKSSYADLASCWDACRGPLSKNGLSVTQPIQGTPEGLLLLTILMHTSGEWVMSQLPIPMNEKTTPQALGSAITYMRRYALSAIVGIAPAEDDGEGAMGRGKEASDKIIPNLDKLLSSAGIARIYLDKEILPKRYQVNQLSELTDQQCKLLEKELEDMAHKKARNVNAALVK